MAAGAADVILDASSLVAVGRTKGVMSKVVANAAMGYFGWQLMVPAKSNSDIKDLNGKKVAITSAGSGSDMLALWTIQDKKINFTRVPVGGGGLVPNLLANNVDGSMSAPNTLAQMQLALDLAKLAGMKDLAPAADIISTQFKPVPTKP